MELLIIGLTAEFFFLSLLAYRGYKAGRWFRKRELLPGEIEKISQQKEPEMIQTSKKVKISEWEYNNFSEMSERYYLFSNGGPNENRYLRPSKRIYLDSLRSG